MRRKYLSLGAGELASAGLFALVAANLTAGRAGGPRAGLVLSSRLVPLLVVLLQAEAYWLLARGWLGRSRMPAGMASLYRGFRLGNVLQLAGGLAGVLAWWPDRADVGVLATAVWLFGVVEHVNYFVVRLSDPARRWAREVVRRRTPRLVQDLAQSRPVRPTTAGRAHGDGAV